MGWSIGAGLEDKGVVVTGAAGGIGRSVTVAFASAGARVCAVDLDQEAVERTVDGLENPSRHIALGLDLVDLQKHEAVLRRAQQELGRFDVLAHLAAALRRRDNVDDVTEDDWNIQINVNLKAAFFLNRTAARIIKEQGRGGRIVNFTSQGWWTGGFGGSVVYAASKGGIVSMTRGLARTYAPHGITVNSVSPGLVDTPMAWGGMTDEAMELLIKQVPLGRMASPDELAGAVVFLASDHASYITGATINVSGGWLMY